MKKEENRTNTGIRCGERLKITITDGDYTLQEGVDYKTYDCRGLDETVWLTVVVGVGKYENIFFRGHENRLFPDGSPLWSQEDAESFREYFRSEIERNKNDVSD